MCGCVHFSCLNILLTFFQVCAAVLDPKKQVSEDLCDGLPNYLQPYFQPCNIFPCYPPPKYVQLW